MDDAGFPKVNTLINGMPACTAGAMGYSVHIPQGLPVPPTMLNMGYWRRYLLNIPKALLLVALTLMANLAIAGISSLFVKPDGATGSFVKDATGIDTSSWDGVWGSIKGSFAAYTQWSTWVKLLMPPVPYPGGQGSAAIGSPNVTVNGGAAGLRGAADGDLVQRSADRAERGDGRLQQCDGGGEHRRHGAGAGGQRRPGGGVGRRVGGGGSVGPPRRLEQVQLTGGGRWRAIAAQAGANRAS